MNSSLRAATELGHFCYDPQYQAPYGFQDQDKDSNLPEKNWRCLNGVRTEVVRTKSTMAKCWDFRSGSALCKYGSSEDTAEHLLSCPLLSQVYTSQALCEHKGNSETSEGFCVEQRWSPREHILKSLALASKVKSSKIALSSARGQLYFLNC